MSCFIISLAGFASNFCLQHFKDRLLYWEQYFHWMFLAWAAVWWFGGGMNEINTHLLPPDKAHAALGFIAISCWFMGWVSLKLKWQDMAFSPRGLAFAAIFILFWVFNSDQWPHPFHRMGTMAWAIAFCAQYYLLFRFEKQWSQKLQLVLHPLTLHLLIFILTWECAWAVERGVNGAKTCDLAVWGGAPGLMVLMLVMFGSRLSWPVRRFFSYYTGKGLTPVMTYLLCWTIFSCFFNGNPSPLPYVPIINPLEIIGASFLGIVVVKLFFIDLDSIGTVARIISFMVVGILMLVIGYFSPLPPKQQIQNN